MSDYLTHIKVLEEEIDATKVVLDADNSTILCLSMSLPQGYHDLVQICAVTPAITAEKARTIALEASRQHYQAQHNSRDPGQAYRAMKQGGGDGLCSHCGSSKHPVDRCWTKNPHLAPKWFQLKLKHDLANKNKKGQAKTATQSREDDFQDHSPHISA